MRWWWPRCGVAARRCVSCSSGVGELAVRQSALVAAARSKEEGAGGSERMGSSGPRSPIYHCRWRRGVRIVCAHDLCNRSMGSGNRACKCGSWGSATVRRATIDPRCTEPSGHEIQPHSSNWQMRWVVGPARRGNSAACPPWIRKRGTWREVRPNPMKSGKIPRRSGAIPRL